MPELIKIEPEVRTLMKFHALRNQVRQEFDTNEQYPCYGYKMKGIPEYVFVPKEFISNSDRTLLTCSRGYRYKRVIHLEDSPDFLFKRI